MSYKWLTEKEFIEFVNSDKLIPVHRIRYEGYFKKMGYLTVSHKGTQTIKTDRL